MIEGADTELVEFIGHAFATFGQRIRVTHLKLDSGPEFGMSIEEAVRRRPGWILETYHSQQRGWGRLPTDPPAPVWKQPRETRPRTARVGG